MFQELEASLFSSQCSSSSEVPCTQHWRTSAYTLENAFENSTMSRGHLDMYFMSGHSYPQDRKVAYETDVVTPSFTYLLFDEIHGENDTCAN